MAHSNNDGDERIEEIQNYANLPKNRSTLSMKILANGTKAEEPDEENELLIELEESSKGKIKGPLILKYLQAAKRPFMLAFLVASILGTQLLANAADIWSSYW